MSAIFTPSSDHILIWIIPHICFLQYLVSWWNIFKGWRNLAKAVSQCCNFRWYRFIVFQEFNFHLWLAGKIILWFLLWQSNKMVFSLQYTGLHSVMWRMWPYSSNLWPHIKSWSHTSIFLAIQEAQFCYIFFLIW